MSINYMYVHTFMQNLYKLLILEELILFVITIVFFIFQNKTIEIIISIMKVKNTNINKYNTIIYIYIYIYTFLLSFYICFLINT